MEMPDAESGERALKLDHSVLGGRRIRVEPTAKGSGNTASRQASLKGESSIRQKQTRTRAHTHTHTHTHTHAQTHTHVCVCE